MHVSTSDLMLSSPKNLREGEPYFDISYALADTDFRYPLIETWIYVGTQMHGRKSKYYFQVVESYLKRGNLLKRPRSRWPKDTGLVVMAANYVVSLLDFSGMAKALARDAARRQQL
jgi:hypothetical protein